MNNRKEVILITGSSGRIGFKAAERFSQQYEIVGFDVLLAGHLPDVDFLSVDMASDESVKEGMAKVKKYGNRIAAVIHLAAYYSFTQEHSSNYERITIRGTERLLKHLQDFEVDQFIFSSTMLVHAPCEVGQRINENSPIDPKWSYPKSKVQTELLIHQERGKIKKTTILRIAGVYDDRCHSIPLSNQIQRIYEKQLTSHLFPGKVNHGASFIHMDDLIEALWLTVQKNKDLPNDSVMLIGEPDTLGYDELQKEFGRLIHGIDWQTIRIPKSLAKIGAWLQDHTPFVRPSFIKPWMIDIADDHYALDVSRARKMIGWEPKYSLKNKLEKMVSELKTDPISWYDENKLRPPVWLLKQSG